MSIPSLEDFHSSAAKWHGEHNGIRYELSWHGKSEYCQSGTWCYYLMLNQEQFYPDDWSQLRLTRDDRPLGESYHRHWSYENFPDVDFHCGATYGEQEIYLGKDGVEYEAVKVGCDYNHSWDRDCGYWQGKTAVEQDAKASIDKLCELFPKRKIRCSYSGKYDDAENFYKARHGGLVHKSRRSEFSEEKWPTWLPETEDSAALLKATGASS